MADNIPITAGSGTNVATDDRTAVTGVAAHVQRVTEIGATAVAAGQATPTNSAGTIVSARDTRKAVIFVNHGTLDVYIGPATVTTSNGMKLPAGSAIKLFTTVALQGITQSGTGAIHYIEEYDS